MDEKNTKSAPPEKNHFTVMLRTGAKATLVAQTIRYFVPPQTGMNPRDIATAVSGEDKDGARVGLPADEIILAIVDKDASPAAKGAHATFIHNLWGVTI